MKLAIYGATGNTGQNLVRQALAAGHEVTAFVRDPARLDTEHQRLHVVTGDVTNATRVRTAVLGQDAVISALGQAKRSPRDVLTVAAHHLVHSMREEGVRRLVTLVGAGVPDERDKGSLGRTFMRGLMKLVARHLLEDAERHAEIVRASGLEWTLVRPPRLTNGPRMGEYRTGYLQLGGTDTISRADLAEFMLDLAVDGRYVREAPMVSY